MPYVQIKLLEGVFSREQKSRMIEKVTEAMVEVEGESLRSFTWVVLEEIPSGDWGIGGKGITAADLRALTTRRPAA
jgi:4-oxalocrotonate tautomerase